MGSIQRVALKFIGVTKAAQVEKIDLQTAALGNGNSLIKPVSIAVQAPSIAAAAGYAYLVGLTNTDPNTIADPNPIGDWVTGAIDGELFLFVNPTNAATGAVVATPPEFKFSEHIRSQQWRYLVLLSAESPGVNIDQQPLITLYCDDGNFAAAASRGHALG